MQKALKAVLLVMLVVLMATFCLFGCELTRKMNGAESTFPGKISDARTLSFKMNVHYKKGDTDTTINMDCYKKIADSGKEEYAYKYTCPEARHASYKNIYADNKLYEIVDISDIAGSYYTKDGVKVDDDGNILYHVTKKIMLTSVAAFLSSAKKETLNGETTYRYDVEISGKNVSIWYNDKAIVKLYAKFNSDGEEEEYTFLLSDYKFNEEISSAVFARPETYGITYVESPWAFETWMDIINSFAKKLG